MRKKQICIQNKKLYSGSTKYRVPTSLRLKITLTIMFATTIICLTSFMKKGNNYSAASTWNNLPGKLKSLLDSNLNISNNNENFIQIFYKLTTGNLTLKR